MVNLLRKGENKDRLNPPKPSKRLKITTKGQERHQLHFRLVQFQLFQISMKNSQSRFSLIHSLIIFAWGVTTPQEAQKHTYGV